MSAGFLHHMTFRKVPQFPRPTVIWAFVVWLLWPGSAALLAAVEPLTVRVEGLQENVLRNVQEALALPTGLVRDGQVDRLWLERFSQQADTKVRSAMEPYGFYSPRITSSIESTSQGGSVLRIRVEPGEPIRITDLNIALTGPGAEDATLKKQVLSFPLRIGDVLDQPVYEQAKLALRARATEQGYLKAEFQIHEIRIEKSTFSARLSLVLETGPLFLIKDISISGAPNYPEPFLRRYLEFKPHDTFSHARLGESQINFTNSERFNDVVITPDIPDGDSTEVPVRVELKEVAPRSLRTGIGYGTDTGARFTSRYRHLNVFKKGQELNLNLFLAETLQGLEARYVFPDDKDFRSATTLQSNLQKEVIDAYTSRLASVELARNHRFASGAMGTAYLKVQAEDYTTNAEPEHTNLVLPGFRYSANKTDSLMRPTRGFRYAFDVRGIYQTRSAISEMLQVLADGAFIVPLPGELSLQSRLNVGYTESEYPTADELPPSLRFYAGGTQTVRGYAYKTLGPLDAEGELVGGKNLLAASVELERAFHTKWGVSVFYDAGNAFDSWEEASLYQSAGLGLHYYSAVGGLNFSLARQIGIEDPGYYFHFSVGFAP